MLSRWHKRSIKNGQGGFTMIEMAVVLVIIGMILSAVMAGKDVLGSSKIKNFVHWTRSWEDALMQFRTQKGYFPGDGSFAEVSDVTPVLLYFKDTTNGVIADEMADQSNSAVFLIKMFIAGEMEDQMTVEGQVFFIKVGNDSGSGADDTKTASTADAAELGDPDRNVIVVCGSINCDKALSADAIPYIEALDKAFDGRANAYAGRVRAITGVAATACSVDLAAHYEPGISIAMQDQIGRKGSSAGAFTANEAKSCIDEVTELGGQAAHAKARGVDGVNESGYDIRPTSNQVGVVYYFDHRHGGEAGLNR
ncbi:MAG: type II secretion system protein [Magnetococcales bacterium]|nr:type II secretion system protein [Magnetococcales bacterium]